MRRKILLGIVLLSLGILILGWLGYSGPLLVSGIYSDWLLAMGRLFGLLAVLAILWQVILIARIPWIEKAVSLDQALIWHHLNGMLAVVFIIGHPILLAMAYSEISKAGFWSQLVGFIVNWEDVWVAFIGAILFITAIALSIPLIKKKYKYEVWYIFHLLIYLAVLLSFGHQLAVGGDFIAQGWFRAWWTESYLIVFTLLVIFRFVRPLWFSVKHNFKISKVVAETPYVQSIYISGRKMEDFHYLAGQFFIVRFLFGKDAWQAHPFSVSKSFDGREIRLTIKSMGDYTSKIKELPVGTRVMLDGPHGALTLDNVEKNKFLLIAGGIGVTPLRALAEDLIKLNKEVILIYANHAPSDLVFIKEFEAWPTEKFKLITLYSQSAVPQYVDEKLINMVAPELGDYEVYVCGPKPMMDTVRGICEKNKLPGGQFHWEKFSF